jgi:hypothetical protein
VKDLDEIYDEDNIYFDKDGNLKGSKKKTNFDREKKGTIIFRKLDENEKEVEQKVRVKIDNGVIIFYEKSDSQSEEASNPSEKKKVLDSIILTGGCCVFCGISKEKKGDKKGNINNPSTREILGRMTNFSSLLKPQKQEDSNNVETVINFLLHIVVRSDPYHGLKV